MEFKHTQLDNGLTVIAEVSGAARSMALGFFVRTGARDETAAVSGVSHFLEHMLFKGTDTRSPIDVNLEFDAMGAKYNAFTSEENTVYYAAVLPEYQERVLTLWADVMRPALRQEDFDLEKGVICEEIAMYKDLPHFDVLDRCRRLHFGEHPSGNSVLGTEETIQGLRRGQMLDYFERRYAPDNMVLACAGRIDWDKLLAQANELCSSWQPRKAQRELSDMRGTGHCETVDKDSVVRQHVCLMSAAPSAQSQMRYAANVLSYIFGDVTGSRLYWALVDTALADSADMEYDTLDGTGAFYTYLSCDPEQAEKVVEIAKDCMRKMRSDGVSTQELEASKNKMASSITLSGEISMGRLVPLGYGWVYRNEYLSLANELEILEAVSPKDIAELLEEYPLDKTTILALGPPAKT